MTLPTRPPKASPAPRRRAAGSRLRRLSYAALALWFGALGACEPTVTEGGEGQPGCLSAPATAMVGGEWLLTGQGSRGDCLEPRLDTDFFRFQALALVVAQDGERLRLVDAPGVAAGVLRLTDGRVQGDCVDFRLVEDGADGPIAYVFDGEVTLDGDIVGSFTGDGPAACTSSGDFRVTVTCCAGSGPNGSTDAGGTGDTADAGGSGDTAGQGDTTPSDVPSNPDAAPAADLPANPDAAPAADLPANPDAAPAADVLPAADLPRSPDAAVPDAPAAAR